MTWSAKPKRKARFGDRWVDPLTPSRPAEWRGSRAGRVGYTPILWYLKGGDPTHALSSSQPSATFPPPRPVQLDVTEAGHVRCAKIAISCLPYSIRLAFGVFQTAADRIRRILVDVTRREHLGRYPSPRGEVTGRKFPLVTSGWQRRILT